MSIAIENTRSPAHISHLLKSIESPKLGLCFDTSHDWLYSDTPFELLRRWKHRLLCTHVCDTDGKRDRHWLPGDGVIDFESFASVFSREQFQGTLILEPSPQDKSEDPMRFLDRAYHRLAAIRDQVTSGSTKPFFREAT